MFDSIKKKINVRTLMSQSEALEENTSELKKGITTLVGLFGERESIKGLAPIQKSKKKIPVQAGEKEQKKEEQKKGGLMDILSPLLGLISAIAPLLAPLAAIGAIGLAFIINPLTAIKYLSKIIIKGFLKFVKGTIKFFKNLIKGIGKIFRRIFDFIGNTLIKVKNFFNDKILRPIKNTIDDLLNSKFVKNIKKAFTNIVDSVKSFIKRGANLIRELFEDVGKKVKTFADDLIQKSFDFTKKLLDKVIDLAGPLVKKIRDIIKGGIQTTIENVGERAVLSIKFVKQFLKDKINLVIGQIYNTINNAHFNIKNIPGLKNIPGYQSAVDSAFDGLKKFVKDPKGTVGKLITDSISKVDDLVQSGKKAGTELIESGKKAGTELITSGVENIKGLVSGGMDLVSKGFNNIKSFGQTVAKGYSDITKGAAEQLKKLQPSEMVKNALMTIFNKVKESVLIPVKNQVTAVLTPLLNPKTYINFFSGVSNIVSPLKKVVEPIFKMKDQLLGFVEKLPGGKAMSKAFRGATGKFDRIFALVETLVSYGQRVKNLKEGISPEEAKQTLLGAGEGIGTALVRVLAGFGGSAIGASLGSLLPGPGTIAGSILGGVLGEEAGMAVAGALSEDSVKDPFGIPIFTKPDPSDSLINMFTGMFGGGGEPPVGGGNGTRRVSPVRQQRAMSEMEDYPEYDVETNIVIVRERAQQSQQMLASSSGGNGGVTSVNISEDSSLNTFKTITMSQLAYV